MSKFLKGNNFGRPQTVTDKVVDKLSSTMHAHPGGFVSSSIAQRVVAMESLDNASQQAIDQGISTLQSALESMSQKGGGIELKLTQAQNEAALVSGMLSANVKAWGSAPIVRNVPAMENASVLVPNGSGFYNARSDAAMAALESFDDRDTKITAIYSMAYNMQAARQDEFGEAFFPTVVVTPDQPGYATSIRVVNAIDEIRRDTSGAPGNMKGRRNILEAVVDHTVLRNDQTKIVPVYDTESASHFVDNTLLAPTTILVDGASVTTSALKIGDTLSLLGISQTDALLETGVLDASDSIDTAVKLAAIYVSIENNDGSVKEVIKLNTSAFGLSTFNQALQGNSRLLNLAFSTDQLLISAATKEADNSTSTLLAGLVSGNYKVRLKTNIFGSINLETADTTINASAITVAKVSNSDGQALPLDSGNGQTMAALFAKAVVVGYDLDANRTNGNRRQAGQRLDHTWYSQIYAVPLRAPMTTARSLSIGENTDTSDLATLTTATHIRISNLAVEALLAGVGMLKEFVSNDTLDSPPDILGVARHLVSPKYISENFDVQTRLDSLTSNDRRADVQALLVNKIRDMAYRLYRDSRYKAAADAMAGGIAALPTVIIGTDPVIAQYLMVDGDYRTLATQFNIRVVTTLDNRMKGKLILSFGDFSEATAGQPNPLHLGNMAWKPELVMVLPTHRNGANVKELSVQPAFLHVLNLPVIGELNITNIEAVIASKVTVNMKDVT